MATDRGVAAEIINGVVVTGDVAGDVNVMASRAALTRSEAEPPYGIIWNRLKAGRVIPFLGAGASFVGRTTNATWTVEHPLFPPSGAELSQFLAEEAQYPSTDRDDLAKVSSYYADLSGRRALRERLREVLNQPFEPGELHRALAVVERPLLIVTTNYDTLIERAFGEAGKPYDLVVYPTERKEYQHAVMWWPHNASEPQYPAPNELDINLKTTTVIFRSNSD